MYYSSKEDNVCYDADLPLDEIIPNIVLGAPKVSKRPRVVNGNNAITGHPRSVIYVGPPTKRAMHDACVRYPEFWTAFAPFHGRGPKKTQLKRFREHLKQRPQLVSAIRRLLKNKDLACLCAPRLCHADILLKIANE
jgi:hypothetical protein